MGNTPTSGVPCMATAAVAKQLHLSKHQVILLHESMIRRAKGGNVPGSIKRKHFCRALDDADIFDEPDREILTLLFTMWDITGIERVPAHEFAVGLTPLACGGDSIATVLSFALQIQDRSGEGKISPSEMMVLLKSINATASYFGDAVLGLRQIYKVVDNIFDSMFVNLSHKEAINRLIKEPSVRMIITKEGTFDLSLSDLDKDKYVLSDEEQGTSFGCGTIAEAPFNRTRLSCDGSDVSSVKLSPIAKVPVVETDSLESLDELHPAAE